MENLAMGKLATGGANIFEEYDNLTGKLLVATPYAMRGSVFFRSVIYVAHHTKSGAMGVIANHLFEGDVVEDIFQKINRKSKTDNLRFDVYLGGPVEPNRGFLLHSADYQKGSLFEDSGNGLSLSSNYEIFRDISDGVGPKERLFAVGYTGWQAGQIEQEIENNFWMVMPADSHMLFNVSPTSKWEYGLSTIGVTHAQYSPYIAKS